MAITMAMMVLVSLWKNDKNRNYAANIFTMVWLFCLNGICRHFRHFGPSQFAKDLATKESN